MLDVADRLHELRCRETDWLLKARAEAIRVQREARVEELLYTRVLDEREALDASIAAEDGVSARALRDSVETACRTLRAHVAATPGTRIGAVVFVAWALHEYASTIGVVHRHFPLDLAALDLDLRRLIETD